MKFKIWIRVPAERGGIRECWLKDADGKERVFATRSAADVVAANLRSGLGSYQVQQVWGNTEGWDFSK